MLFIFYASRGNLRIIIANVPYITYFIIHFSICTDYYLYDIFVFTIIICSSQIQNSHMRILLLIIANEIKRKWRALKVVSSMSMLT